MSVLSSFSDSNIKANSNTFALDLDLAIHWAWEIGIGIAISKLQFHRHDKVSKCGISYFVTKDQKILPFHFGSG